MKPKVTSVPDVKGNYRRSFLKAQFANIAAFFGLSQSARAAVETTDKVLDATNYSDLHICRGLNTNDQIVNGKNYRPGTAPVTNIPQKDLHGCKGGNTCQGLGGCGTGDYATQYWATENACGRTGDDWNGTGGCGVPLGSTNTGFICSQLNNAVPVDPSMPMDYIGVPVWAIARSRFEAKMVAANNPFDKPVEGCGSFTGNEWKPGQKYSRGHLPMPVHENAPPRKSVPGSSNTTN